MVEVKIIPMGVKGPKQKKKASKKRKPLPSRHTMAVDPNMKRAVTGMMRQNAKENLPLSEKAIKTLIIKQMKPSRLYSKEEFAEKYDKIKSRVTQSYKGSPPINHNTPLTEEEIKRKNDRIIIVKSNSHIRQQQEQMHSNARSLRKERMLDQQRLERKQKYELYKFRKQEENKK